MDSNLYNLHFNQITMKTALQELIDEIKLIEAYPMNPLVLKMAEDLLEKEKEQIQLAFEIGTYNCNEEELAQEYYNQTYKNK